MRNINGLLRRSPIPVKSQHSSHHSLRLVHTGATKDSDELARATAIVTYWYDVAQRTLSIRYVVEDID